LRLARNALRMGLFPSSGTAGSPFDGFMLSPILRLFLSGLRVATNSPGVKFASEILIPE
jgi:hypothetical protein